MDIATVEEGWIIQADIDALDAAGIQVIYEDDMDGDQYEDEDEDEDQGQFNEYAENELVTVDPDELEDAGIPIYDEDDADLGDIVG